MKDGKTEKLACFSAILCFEAKLWLTTDKQRHDMDESEYKHVTHASSSPNTSPTGAARATARAAYSASRPRATRTSVGCSTLSTTSPPREAAPPGAWQSSSPPVPACPPTSPVTVTSAAPSSTQTSWTAWLPCPVRIFSALRFRRGFGSTERVTGLIRRTMPVCSIAVRRTQVGSLMP